MKETPTIGSSREVVALRLTLTGRVQGIGLRPAIARWASHLDLAGSVSNTRGGVQIHVEGPRRQVRRFVDELTRHLPAQAEVQSRECQPVAPRGCREFRIATSTDAATVSPLAARVPMDVVACDDCLAEVATTTDRRHGYPFTSCTNCGPRYSIIDDLPYERSRTGMAGFAMCGSCRHEYESTTDRRFHAQTNACPRCGPQVWMSDVSQNIVARHDEALSAAAGAIREGHILALRGLGGYQLVVDATSPNAVMRLRERKRRQGKPLAVMVRCLDEASRLALLDCDEQRLLRDPAGPIVIVPLRGDFNLAADVVGGLNTIGLMLPTTPLHWELLDRCRLPLVVTSGNCEGKPLAYREDEVRRQCAGVADFWLEHDRPIQRPVDDSVVRVMAGRAVTMRLARGYAPLSLDLDCDESLIALGGHQKVALALANGRQAVLGPHVGDLDTVAARQRYLEQLRSLCELYDMSWSAAQPETHFVCDQHPEYFTSRWAERLTNVAVRVQHHHAHVVAGMLQHDWLDRQVLGVAFDGTGYGTDGTIWGGEFLRATTTEFRRVAYLRPFCLPGGEQAVRQPWRVSTALVRDAVGTEEAARLDFVAGSPKLLLPLLGRPQFSPTTTSAGRLFDGVAALVLGVGRNLFEGQAAMLLEAACDTSALGQYEMPVIGRDPAVVDWRPLIAQLLQDRRAAVPPGTMAMRFHRGLARAISELCQQYADLPVVLCGGVFQNRVLVEVLVESFEGSRQPLGLPGTIPPNDGGLAAGQLAVVATCGPRGGRKSCV